MKASPPAPSPLLASCALCDRLHVPKSLLESNPVCPECVRALRAQPKRPKRRKG